jgi:hypothetical protein
MVIARIGSPGIRARALFIAREEVLAGTTSLFFFNTQEQLPKPTSYLSLTAFSTKRTAP